MSLNHSPAIVTDGLVLCLDAANVRSYPKSGTTWSDLAGANDGTLTNMDAANFSNDNRGSLSFDGTNEYISLPSDLISGNASPLSLSFVFSTADTNADKKIFAYGQEAQSGRMLAFTVESAGLRYRHEGGNITYGAGQISANNWTFVTMVLDSGATTTDDMKCYINSVRYAGSRTAGSNQTINISSSSQRYLGRYDASYFSGSIAMFQYYNRALTADEIRRNYEATVGRYT